MGHKQKEDPATKRTWALNRMVMFLCRFYRASDEAQLFEILVIQEYDRQADTSQRMMDNLEKKND